MMNWLRKLWRSASRATTPTDVSTLAREHSERRRVWLAEQNRQLRAELAMEAVRRRATAIQIMMDHFPGGELSATSYYEGVVAALKTVRAQSAGVSVTATQVMVDYFPTGDLSATSYYEGVVAALNATRRQPKPWDRPIPDGWATRR